MRDRLRVAEASLAVERGRAAALERESAALRAEMEDACSAAELARSQSQTAVAELTAQLREAQQRLRDAAGVAARSPDEQSSQAAALRSQVKMLTDRLVDKQQQLEQLQSERAAMRERLLRVDGSVPPGIALMLMEEGTEQSPAAGGRAGPSLQSSVQHLRKAAAAARAGRVGAGAALSELDSAVSDGLSALVAGPQGTRLALLCYLACVHVAVLLAAVWRPS